MNLPVLTIIAGQGNRISPSKLPHYYNVLDWFHVTDVWCEITHGFKCWMVRLEKIDLHQRSWWAPKGLELPPSIPNFDMPKTTAHECQTCHFTSKLIYNQGPTCLNPDCAAFFHFGDFNAGLELDYNWEFVHERTQFFGEQPEPLQTPLITEDLMEVNGYCGFEAEYAKGTVCPMCKGCSRRINWSYWECEHGCKFTHAVRQKVIPVCEAQGPIDFADKGYIDRTIGITFNQSIAGPYDVYNYTLPSEEPGQPAGFVRHFKPTGNVNGRPDGANDLFKAMQGADFGLKRHAARQRGCTLFLLHYSYSS
jgi:hypothetical protein